jgi:hypothetical protein
MCLSEPVKFSKNFQICRKIIFKKLPKKYGKIFATPGIFYRHTGMGWRIRPVVPQPPDHNQGIPGLSALPKGCYRTIPAVEKHPHFRARRIRAFCGLRLAPFPDPEGIIPENGGINPGKCPFLRRRREVNFSHVLLAEKELKRFQPVAEGPAGAGGVQWPFWRGSPVPTINWQVSDEKPGVVGRIPDTLRRCILHDPGLRRRVSLGKTGQGPERE